jgi:protein TonB
VDSIQPRRGSDRAGALLPALTARRNDPVFGAVVLSFPGRRDEAAESARLGKVAVIDRDDAPRPGPYTLVGAAGLRSEIRRTTAAPRPGPKAVLAAATAWSGALACMILLELARAPVPEPPVMVVELQFLAPAPSPEPEQTTAWVAEPEPLPSPTVEPVASAPESPPAVAPPPEPPRAEPPLAAKPAEPRIAEAPLPRPKPRRPPEPAKPIESAPPAQRPNRAVAREETPETPPAEVMDSRTSAAAMAAPAPPAAAPRVDMSYERVVLARLERHKEYPRAARLKGIQGRALLRLRVTRDGRIAEARIAEGSGSEALDAATLEMARRADPLPPLPPEFPGAVADFIVPVAFSLSRS